MKIRKKVDCKDAENVKKSTEAAKEVFGEHLKVKIIEKSEMQKF